MANHTLQDGTVDPAAVRNVAKRALLFQRYLFRRAIGISYAIWALTIALNFFLPMVLQTFLGSSGWYWIVSPVAQSIIYIVAAIVSLSSFRRITWAFDLQNAINSAKINPSERRIKIALYIVFFALIAACLVIFQLQALTIVYGLVLTMTFFMVSQLRRLFPQGIPIESKLAAIVLGAGALTSFVLSIVFPGQFFDAPWMVIVVVWLFCALYALKSAPEEWVERTD